MQCIGTGDVIQISSIVVHVSNWNRALRNIWYAVVKFENVSEWDGYEWVKKGIVSASCTRKLCVRMRALTLFNCVAQSDYAILYIWHSVLSKRQPWAELNVPPQLNSTFCFDDAKKKKEFISILNLLLFSLLIFCILHSWAAWPGMHIVFFLLYQFNGRHWSKSSVCAGSTHGNNNAGKSWMQLSFIYSYVVHCNPLGLSYTATRKTKL